MNTNSSQDDDSIKQLETENPYAVQFDSDGESISTVGYNKEVLGRKYWIGLIGANLLFILLLFSSQHFFPFLMTLVTLLAILRSGLLVYKFKSGKYLKPDQIPVINRRIFFVSSLAYGFLNVVAGTISYAVICVPVSLFGFYAVAGSKGDAASITVFVLSNIISIVLTIRLLVVFLWYSLPQQ